MKLVSFSVKNYRSITTATKKIPLSNYSLLIGANNEGKSNILHALNLAMTTLVYWENLPLRSSTGRYSPMDRVSLYNLSNIINYDWQIDYPINKQASANSNSTTDVLLEFELDDFETTEFKEQIKSNLNGTLPLLFSFGKDLISVSVNKQGRGKAALTRKRGKIAEFISRRIKFVYIPSIRTSETADNIINRIIMPEMNELLKNDDYVGALKRIEELRKPVFDEFASAIQENISDFLPSVKSVKLDNRYGYRHGLFHGDIELIIDDGFPTRLERKGDGVQSLVAVALMRYASERGELGKNTIIAIEEPEAHLHPGAAHELTSVFNTLAKSSQIVITSHSPYFVNLNYLQNTIIVHDNRAVQAKNIAQIRSTLGIRLSDNLQSAELVILVEGPCDVMALRSIISSRSKLLKSALETNALAVVGINGVSSLSNMASFYKGCSCNVMCILDKDDAAREAVNKAVKCKTLEINEVTYCSVPDMRESELEDLYDDKVYGKLFYERFGVDLLASKVRRGRVKWSTRIKRVFEHSGAHWDQPTMASIKWWLAEYASKNPINIILADLSEPIDNFIAAVEARHIENL